jgi:DNA repair exonuclease SbcCD nuclease subunit
MRLPALAVSDLHLTANPRDSYRWDIFPWLINTCARYQVKTLLVLGDLTDAKDYHSAELVNKVSDAFASFRSQEADSTIEKIYILMGNHDYLKTGQPFFHFLNHYDYIEFITEPLIRLSEYSTVALLPHTKTPASDWSKIDFRGVDLVFMHQTVSGSVASNGMELSGELDNQLKAVLPRSLPKDAQIYSGDIHKPQCIGDVTYVGSPYPVHFGDTEILKYRALLLAPDLSVRSLYPPNIHRISIKGNLTQVKSWKLDAGDQVKIKLQLGSEDRQHWERIRREAEDHFKSQGVQILSLELSSARQRVPLVSRVKESQPSTASDLILKHVESEGIGSYLYELAQEIIK